VHVCVCVAVCYTEACTYLDRRPPKISLVAVTPVLSIISTLTVNLAAQVTVFFWLTHQSWLVAAAAAAAAAAAGGGGGGGGGGYSLA